ncbi:MAG: ribonuclease III [Candidatus Hydrogenedentes bacterium]|nr:ribonuclease III [Candidatus Hydrogenedentota bacterium]
MGQNLELLDQALTHSSWVNENPEAGLSDNENLEFLGDAVLDLVVSDYLYRHSPDRSPGLYTRLRANVVNRTILARKARELGIGAAMRLGKGEELTHGRDKDSVLADALEAIIGAQFIAAGYHNSEKMILDMLKSEIDDECQSGGDDDHKSKLQNFAQETYKEVPRYRIAKTTGPDHDRRFDIEVIVRGRVMGKGSGKSKKIAEQAAARMAMERIAGRDMPSNGKPET